MLWDDLRHGQNPLKDDRQRGDAQRVIPARPAFHTPEMRLGFGHDGLPDDLHARANRDIPFQIARLPAVRIENVVTKQNRLPIEKLIRQLAIAAVRHLIGSEGISRA